ncbi:Aminoacyl-tRNA synthetase, class II (D/K/N)-like domain-containing protein [Rozella allomycis CSF55]|uniref:aspartate--tRNA ligase n=1 Tax=Rozella allomycis (strain CSF55) TaxID=988480 RepID=A0A075AUE1_ROZAC|nr:Aminoacyl-tRNA synthetase, class II (D/K/N)-like domain-containing protein [Rozella allomycis CSF55]|eukprot:EPZ32107.1 Aminoacyl-tRNA synthetase, class II (D/K/N)-like domain-containing protein [Rozella allomycis CSF55]
MEPEQLEVEKIKLADGEEKVSKKALKKLEKEREKERRKAETAARLEAEKIAREENDVSAGKYGTLEMINSSAKSGRKWTAINNLTLEMTEKSVLIRGRLHNSRMTGKQTFMVLRGNCETVQVIVAQSHQVSKQMLKFSAGIPKESIVDIEGIVKVVQTPVESCTISTIEILADTVFVVTKAEKVPIQIEDASRTPEEIEQGKPSVDIDTRLNNRVIDLRTLTNQAIFKIQHGICSLFREYLESHNFIEIHSPKLISAASEGGASVFKVDYFNGKAFLAQSPQFYKQMAICSDFARVYEIAPVFRAENSQTHRHMTEFIGLDLEMSFNEHYHEVVHFIAYMFNHIFKGLEAKFSKELSIVQRQYPFEKFEFLEQPLILNYSQGIEMLRVAGFAIGDFDDLSTEMEKSLGKLVKEKYKTDFYVLDKFPLAVRPFYTMPDPNNPGYSNSYDFFIRGEEILSGAQRVHDPTLLSERAASLGVEPESIQSYIDAFKFGAPPHAGGGIGLERVVMLYMNLKNIRNSSLFPRDPKRLNP